MFEVVGKLPNWQAVRIEPTLGIPQWERPTLSIQAIDNFWAQVEAGTLGAFGGGDQPDGGGDERRVCGNGERVERLGEDLRREPGDGEQYAVWVEVWGATGRWCDGLVRAVSCLLGGCLFGQWC